MSVEGSEAGSNVFDFNKPVFSPSVTISTPTTSVTNLFTAHSLTRSEFQDRETHNNANKLKESVSFSHTGSIDAVDGDVGYETESAASGFTDSQDVASLKRSISGVVHPVVSHELAKAGSSQTDDAPTPMLTRSISATFISTEVASKRLADTATPRSPRYCEFDDHEINLLKDIQQKQYYDIPLMRQDIRELKSALQDSAHKNLLTISALTAERDKLKLNESKLIQQVHEKVLNNKQMRIVMEEFAETISVLIEEQQKNKLQNEEIQHKLLAERDEALQHLSNMECSFNDLLSRYTKCKSILMEVKEREKIFKEKLDEYEDGMKKYEELYNNLKQQASDNLAKANETLENNNKSHNIKVAKLKASIQKLESINASLQASFAQKSRDMVELALLCNKLIDGC